jgi:hypothetical protein
MTSFLSYLKLGVVAAFIVALGAMWAIHEHDKNTIASKDQLLAQANEKQALDGATITQLRADLTQSNVLVGGLAAQTVVAYKAANDAKVQAAKDSAPILHEIDTLKKKAAAPEATSKTCSDAISEWRKRQ